MNFLLDQGIKIERGDFELKSGSMAPYYKNKMNSNDSDTIWEMKDLISV